VEVSVKNTAYAVAVAILIMLAQVLAIIGLMRWAPGQFRKWDDSIVILGIAMQMAMLLLRAARQRRAPKPVMNPRG
jgi:hypothetical protein